MTRGIKAIWKSPALATDIDPIIPAVILGLPSEAQECRGSMLEHCRLCERSEPRKMRDLLFPDTESIDINSNFTLTDDSAASTALGHA